MYLYRASLGKSLTMLFHRQLINEGKGVEDTYWELVIKDIQDACELLEPIYNETGGAMVVFLFKSPLDLCLI